MSTQVPIAYYLILAAILFSIGVAAFLIKRNVITIFMSIELMLNAVNLTFVAFAHMWHQVSRPDLRLLRHGRRRRRSRRRPRHHHRHLPYPPDAQRRSDQPDEKLVKELLELNATRIYLWLIPLLPFAGFLINGTLGRKLPRALVSAVALLFTAMPAAHRRVALGLHEVRRRARSPSTSSAGPWIAITGFQVNFAFTVDHLTLIMLGVVTGVGFLIHVYSVGYMAHEEGYWRFFAYLNLFMFFMLVLVLAASFLLLFVGWEGVGLASYLLIGFYFTKDSAANAGKKAFIVNRIGDFGFLLAMFLLIAALRLARLQPRLRAHRRAPRAGMAASSPPSPCCSSSEPPANPRRSPSTSGCPTPWKAPRPSPRSSTRRRWSRPAST